MLDHDRKTPHYFTATTLAFELSFHFSCKLTKPTGSEYYILKQRQYLAIFLS